MQREHTYSVSLVWTGNTGQGTSDYRSYTRDHEINVPGKPSIYTSADPKFRGDPARYNPEELLVSSLSSCHMLTFLAIACKKRFVLDEYADEAVGLMEKNAEGRLAITHVTLRQRLKFSGEKQPTPQEIEEMNHGAHEQCFIANSVKTEVKVEPQQS